MSINRSQAAAWWRDLQPDPTRHAPGDRAASARLRRCGTVNEAMLDPATMQLFRRCGGTGPRDLPSIALAAAVLAHVRQDRPGTPIARQLGPTLPDKPETAIFKPLRFRRLMEAATPDERLIAFRRMVALAGQSLNVADLADALLDWSDWRQRAWVYDYWNAGQMSVRPAEETVA